MTDLTVTFEHDVRSAVSGIAVVQARCVFQAPEPGFEGGWTLAEATVEGEASRPISEREFESRFGFGALDDLFRHASDEARRLNEPDPDRGRD